MIPQTATRPGKGWKVDHSSGNYRYTGSLPSPSSSCRRLSFWVGYWVLFLLTWRYDIPAFHWTGFGPGIEDAGPFMKEVIPSSVMVLRSLPSFMLTAVACTTNFACWWSSGHSAMLIRRRLGPLRSVGSLLILSCLLRRYIASSKTSVSLALSRCSFMQPGW